MENYYVINGNEYGADLCSKINFKSIDEAKAHFEKVKYDDFFCGLIHVKQNGLEESVETFINE